MKAFILAAGEGRRMRPLTLTTPKPLLMVNNYSLIEHLLMKLKKAGINEVIINVHYLAEQIQSTLGNGNNFGLDIEYSVENPLLETGGALFFAKNKLQNAPFILVNSDVWLEYDFNLLVERAKTLDALMHMMMVENPTHNIDGDFCIDEQSRLIQKNTSMTSYTFSGVSIINPELLNLFTPDKQEFPLKKIIDWAIQKRQVQAEICSDFWLDVGTPERFSQLKKWLDNKS